MSISISSDLWWGCPYWCLKALSWDLFDFLFSSFKRLESAHPDKCHHTSTQGDYEALWPCHQTRTWYVCQNPFRSHSLGSPPLPLPPPYIPFTLYSHHWPRPLSCNHDHITPQPPKSLSWTSFMAPGETKPRSSPHNWVSTWLPTTNCFPKMVKLKASHMSLRSTPRPPMSQ